MGPTHPATLANEEFQQLVTQLHSSDVSIADIARAANVTHRAISRRVNK
jgi:IS30 family transposase